MEILAIVLMIAAIAGFVIWFYLTKRSREFSTEIAKAFSSAGIDKQYWTVNHTYTTPGGVPVSANRPIPSDKLAIIDEGISAQIEAYNRQNPNWTAGKSLSEYNVYVIKPMGTNMDGSPCLFVKGYQSAGTMLGAHELWEEIDRRPIVVICDQVDQEWRYPDYFRASADYESEHAREWLCRRMEPTGIFYYWATAGDVHPHAQRVATLKSTPFQCAGTAK